MADHHKTADERAAKQHRIDSATARGVAFGVVKLADIRKFANPHDAFQGLQADDEVVVRTIVHGDPEAPVEPVPATGSPVAAPASETEAAARVEQNNTPKA